MFLNVKKYFFGMLAVILIVFFFLPQISLAVGLIPFGGTIDSVDRSRCTCPFAPAAIVTVGSPKGGRFIYYYYYSRLYQWYLVAVGKKVVGIAAPFGICLKVIPSPPYCIPEDYAPSILRIGTSKL